MKLTKTQYKKLEELMPTMRKLPRVSNYKFTYAMLYIIENGCKWRALSKKYGKWHTAYLKFNKMVQKRYNCQSYCFFFQKLILAAIKKQKLLNKENFILFIDSTSINVIQTQIGIEILKNRVLDVQKEANNEVTFMLYSFMSSNFSLISRQLLQRL